MSALTALFSGPWAERLGWVLINFIWQGAVIALLLAAALRIFSRASSHVRYVVIGGALLLCAMMPVATWMLSDSAPEMPVQPAAFSGPAKIPQVEMTGARGLNDTSSAVSKSPDPTAKVWQERLRRAANAALPYVVGLWLIGVVLLTIRLTLGWTSLRRLCRSGLPIGDSARLERFARLMTRMRVGVPVRLLESALVEVPTLIGWLRPTILVPASVLIGLTPEQLDAILSHELAHVRRYDYLVNLFQTVIETVLFYHPAVWWISRKLREERENCCDDIALEVMQDRLVYVSALAQLEEARAMPLAMTASGGSLLQRIRRIVNANDRKASALPLWLLIIGLLTVVCLSQTKTKAAQPGKETEPDVTLVPSPPTTPLRTAIINNKMDEVKTLLDHGATIYMEDVTEALLGKHQEVMKILWDNGARYCSELTYKISQDAPVGELKKLLDGGMRVNPPEDVMLSPLAVAARWGNLEAAKLLIDNGANFDPTDDSLFIPLNQATRAEDPEMVDFLLKRGAHARTFSFIMAIGGAIDYHDQKPVPGAEKTLELLIQSGCLKKMTEDHAAFLLTYTAEHKNRTALKRLLDAGLNPLSKRTEPPDQGKTAIDILREETARSTTDEPWNKDLKPMIEMLEAAGKDAAASAPNPVIQTTTFKQGDAAPALAAGMEVKVSIALSGKKLIDWTKVKFGNDGSMDSPTTPQIDLSAPVKLGENGNFRYVNVFPYPVAFDEPKTNIPTTLADGTPVNVTVPMTPTDFKRSDIGWWITIFPSKGKDGIVQLVGTAYYTTVSLKKQGAYGENSGAIYSDIKDPKTGKVEHVLVAQNASPMPAFQTSETPFFVFAKPGQSYVVKLQAGDETVDATIKCDLP